MAFLLLKRLGIMNSDLCIQQDRLHLRGSTESTVCLNSSCKKTLIVRELNTVFSPRFTSLYDQIHTAVTDKKK